MKKALLAKYATKKNLILLLLAGIISAAPAIAGTVTSAGQERGGYEGLIPPSSSTNYAAATNGGYTGVTAWKASANKRTDGKADDIYSFVKDGATANTPTTRYKLISQQAQMEQERERQFMQNVRAKQDKKRQEEMKKSLQLSLQKFEKIEQQHQAELQAKPVQKQ